MGRIGHAYAAMRPGRGKSCSLDGNCHKCPPFFPPIPAVSGRRIQIQIFVNGENGKSWSPD